MAAVLLLCWPTCYAVALVSPLDQLANDLFAFHMVQHLLLGLVGAPLVLLGAPMIPVLRGIPRPFRKSAVAPLLRHLWVRRSLKTLSHPFIAWTAYVATVLAWHMPPAFDLALRNEIVHDLEHLNWSLAGILFWWNVIDPVPLQSNLSPLGRVPYVFLTTVPNFILGAFITFAPAAWYEHYLEQPLLFGLTAHADQQIAGVIMWVPGALILLGALLAVLVLVVTTEERRQREQEVLAGIRRPAQ